MIDPAARARLDRWKQSLLDPTDRLLDVADHGVSIDVDPVRLAFSLAAGSGFGFEAGSDPAFDAGRLRVVLPASELAERLDGLRLAARDGAAEGEHVLWLALGLVAYTDAAGAPHRAPLVLWPVTLERGAAAPRLVAARERLPRLNDLLADRLHAEYGLVLGAPSDELDLAAVLEAAESAVASQPGWCVERTTRLGVFSFARFDLWRDLDARGDELLAGPVAWLAGAQSAPALSAARSTELLAPLDADASQLAAVTAAGSGGSFVLHGPPGTGKSQTIANLIVHCASHGKTVLVVSDRPSALAVIQQRLAAVGLADFSVSLLDGRAGVLGALARMLDRAFRPGSGPSGFDARLAELRAALDGHVGALHAVGPFGMSMHEVLGRLVELRTTPCAALAEGDAPGLGRATYEQRRRAVEALADAALPVEPVATHPWRASSLAAWPADGTERASRALADATAAAETLSVAVGDVLALVPGLVARSSEQLRALGTLGEVAAASPRPGAELLTNTRGGRVDDIGERVALIRARGGGTIETPRDPATFLAIATRHAGLVAEIAESFTGAIAELDAPELWIQLKRWTTSMAPLRFVALRAARAEVRAAAIPGRLETDDAMIAALEPVIAERTLRTALVAAAEPARRWFGELAGDPLALDLDRIEGAVAWGAELRRAFDQASVAGGDAGRQAAWRALVAQVAASPDTDADVEAGGRGAFARLARAVRRWDASLVELAAATGVSRALLGAGADHLATLREQLAVLGQAAGSLEAWTRFHLARRAAIVAGVGPAVAAIERGDLGAAELAAAWQRATLLAWAEFELSAVPALARFQGAKHHANVAAFADLDRGALALVRARAVARLADRVPRGAAKQSDPEVAILRQELERAGRPLHAVLGDLPTLTPKLAPCVLATPHAIASHLAASLPAFDLVVFDEASRVPVAHALGALARARAAIIVGDAHQPVPPAGTDGLLDAAISARLPELSLAAHYRSRHEDLFAFANRRYYGDRLEVMPVPHGSPDLGISWRQLDGQADAAGANRVEAEAIVAELGARLRDPAQRSRSLAVVAMSRAQHQLIEEVLELARATDRALDTAFAGEEPLLIGTPDRLQGEERDVVLVSVGHTADALGVLAHPGGERWLDVATTRAREQLVIVSSFAPEAIAAEAPATARDLADLLAFARAGGGAGRPAEDAAPTSPITAAIARALADRGWTVRHGIGCGSFRIDLAVVDPSEPERYVLAIEHDGLAYASGAGGRVRDRLRAQRLGQLGWRLHRVWSLDWWTDQEREIQRAHGAIVAAVAASRQRRSAPVRAPRASQPPLAAGSAPVAHPQAAQHTTPISFTGETARIAASADHTPDTLRVPLASGSGPTDAMLATSAPVRLPRGTIAIGPYAAAAVPAGRRAPDDMFAPRHLAELGKVVEQVLAAEAPIHIDLLARRAAAYFGIGKITPRVVEQVQSAVLGRGKWGDEKGVVWRVDQDPTSVPPVRVAGSNAAAKRSIAEVPLCELASAARIVVERANGMAAADLVRDCARLLGFARITSDVTERVGLGVRLATARQLIAIDAGKARLPVD